MKKIWLFIFFAFVTHHTSLAQLKGQPRIDSLRNFLATNKTPDSSRLKVLLDCSRTFANMNADSAIAYARKSLDIATALNNKRQIAASYNSLGLGMKVKGNYAEALQQYFSALKLYKELNDKVGMGRIHNNLGNVYNYKHNYDEALKNFKEALKLKNELHDKSGVGGCLNNIGLAYFNQHKLDEALQYYQWARDTLMNGGDKQFLAIAVENVGDIKEANKEFKEAEKCYKEALNIRQEMNEPLYIAGSYNSLGHLYQLMGNYKDAIKYNLQALDMNKTINSNKLTQDCSKVVYQSYESLKDYKNALVYYKLYVAANDSVNNMESDRKMIEQQYQFEFDKKEALAKADQDKKDAVNNERLMREQSAKKALIGGVALMIIIAGIAFYAFIQKRKDNKIISKLANEQEIVIEQRTHELAVANHDLADSNKKLRELIQYNAHQVREPLTRITGVMGIMDDLSNEEFMQDFWPEIARAVNDLDGRVKNIIQKAQENDDSHDDDNELFSQKIH